jgi:hypothetical protein
LFITSKWNLEEKLDVEFYFFFFRKNGQPSGSDIAEEWLSKKDVFLLLHLRIAHQEEV